ncbi:hypothetical protein PR048_018547 [Dryococelus australis]|uniref:C-type lectin domain-containing protein n=1 Tax=Dryococelus australis TaxID=614101 RepID=A0ABQ9HCR7_9NEOP|nr:hypothetical protein PR048_018547 [Dryococelus australis]
MCHIAAATGASSVWVGGRRESGEWRWRTSGAFVANTTTRGQQYPPWDGDVAQLEGKACLALGRGHHDSPLFVPADCHRTRPFVCAAGKTGANCVSGRTPFTYKEGKSCMQQGDTYHRACNKETRIAVERVWAALASDWGHAYLPRSDQSEASACQPKVRHFDSPSSKGLFDLPKRNNKAPGGHRGNYGCRAKMSDEASLAGAEGTTKVKRRATNLAALIVWMLAGVDGRATQPFATQWDSVRGRDYVLYSGHVTWSEALAFCRAQGMTLATVPSRLAADILAEGMLRSRPGHLLWVAAFSSPESTVGLVTKVYAGYTPKVGVSPAGSKTPAGVVGARRRCEGRRVCVWCVPSDVESAWIGGVHEDDQGWVWAASGARVADVTGDDGYPPWRHNRSEGGDGGCLQLDRHLCDRPMFLQTTCDRARSFFCQTRERPYRTHHNYMPFTIKRAVIEQAEFGASTPWTGHPRSSWGCLSCRC